MRTRSVVLMVTLACVAAGLSVGLWRLDVALDRRWGTPADERAAIDGPRAADILREWDERRAAAYASGDAQALRELYAAESDAAARDLGTLRRYEARGIRVTGMRTQLLAVDVRREEPDRLELVVTDRLASATAESGDRSASLPRDRASTHRLALTHSTIIPHPH